MADKGISVISHNGEDYNINDPNIAGEFYPNSNYAVGDHVTHEGKLYVFTAAHTGAWTGTDVTQVQIGAELHDYGAHAMVRYDVAQTLTDAQKTVARNNIGAASGSVVSDQGIFLSNLSAAVGTVPTGETVEGQIGDLKSAIDDFNAYNYLVPYPTGESTYAGITWSWDGNTCHYSGTSTAISFCRLYWVDRYHMPTWMKPGETYVVDYQSTDNNVAFNCVFYKNGEIIGELDYYYWKDGVLTVPTDAEGVQIRLFMRPDKTVNGSIKVALLNNYSNEDLAEQIEKVFPLYVPSGSTFSLWDDMPSPSYFNGVPSYFVNSIAEDLGLKIHSTYQVIKFVNRVYISAPAAEHMFLGQRADNGIQYWLKVATGEYFGARGIVEDGTDIDDVITAGYYYLISANNHDHAPFTGNNGVLLVFPASANQKLQLVVKNVAPPKMYYRISYLGEFPETWTEIGGNTYNNTYLQEHYENTYNITCSPAISTDTNNYLPSTNDSTDRTGDIQTLLNTTGVCNLGPGDFYITGIELPSYGFLRGSGAKTRIVLASSVTNGYAVKLGNFSCVKYLRIVGSTESYTPSATVGNRHGILFEATGNASTNPTYKYNATVENCFITDFSGGAITCNNTGISVDQCVEVCDCHIKRCDAGINVAYRSEFHHFTNINATGCYYGCICNGGNCLFANCNFSGNVVGILIDNSTGQSPNNAHGVFSCCKVAHSGNNTGIGIKVIGSETCENFNGISFDYGHIVVENSKGVQFTGCRFGRNTVFDITDSTATIFDACIIRDASSVTVNNSNSSTHFIKCYNSVDGDPFDPLNGHINTEEVRQAHPSNVTPCQYCAGSGWG